MLRRTLPALSTTVAAHRDKSRSALGATGRFIEKADKFGITPEKILAPHRERTIERMRTQDTVLGVQDGTDISYSTRPRDWR